MNKNNKNISIIIGCGSFGATIADELSLKGEDVILIDKNLDAFRKATNDFSGFTIEADGSDIDVLEKAGIKNANNLIAVTDNDNVNILASMIAKNIYNVPNVITRLFDTHKEVILENTNIKTIYPTKLSLNVFNELIKEGEN